MEDLLEPAKLDDREADYQTRLLLGREWYGRLDERFKRTIDWCERTKLITEMFKVTEMLNETTREWCKYRSEKWRT